MDAKEYVRERERMLNSLGRTGWFCNGVNCGECYFYNSDDSLMCFRHTEKAVDIVEKWSKEHPKRTYLDVLLEAFPDTPMKKDGIPLYITCPYALGLKIDDDVTCFGSDDCDACWHREYKEDK